MFATVLNGAPSYDSTCEGNLKIQIELQSVKVFTYGVVVGDLIVENSSDNPCVFKGGISIGSGNFSFELEQPDGSMIVLENYNSHGERESFWQKVELNPGDKFVYPICLLKLKNKYIFKEPGEYKLRGIYHGKENTRIKNWRWLKSTKEENHWADPVPAKSDWVGIFVKNPHGRRRLYTESHPWKNVYMAFLLHQGIERIWGQLGGYYEYNHEQEKLLVYQRASGFLHFIHSDSKEFEVPLAEAKEVLSLARKCGVGIKMWEWIIQNLEEFKNGESDVANWSVRNGYMFR